MRSIYAIAWRNLLDQPLRNSLCILSVSLGVAMVLAAQFVSTALLAVLSNAGEGDLQITHGFIVEQFDLILRLVGYVLITASAFVTFNAFAMTVSQRRQQIGMLRSLGMTRTQVLRLVLAEALLVGSGGTLVGLALGPLLGRGTVTVMKHFGGQFLAFGQGSVSLSAILAAVALGVSVALASALIPARRAMRVTPLAALRSQATFSRRAPIGPMAVASTVIIILLFFLLAVVVPGEKLNAPWNSRLALFLVLIWLASLGMMLPACVVVAGRLTRRWAGRRTAQGRLVGDNLQRDRSRVMLNLLTLAVGLATITGITGFMAFAFNDL